MDSTGYCGERLDCAWSFGDEHFIHECLLSPHTEQPHRCKCGTRWEETAAVDGYVDPPSEEMHPTNALVLKEMTKPVEYGNFTGDAEWDG